MIDKEQALPALTLVLLRLLQGSALARTIADRGALVAVSHSMAIPMDVKSETGRAGFCH